MSANGDLGSLRRPTRHAQALTLVRMLLPLGWMAATVGYFGPWIAHRTAGLTLSGVDVGEFVKFLPAVMDGRLALTRQLFYLPPFAVVVGIAFLVGSEKLSYPLPFQILIVLAAVPVSLQLLPPAWSPASLDTNEFRLQALGLGVCWLLMAGFRLLRRLPPWMAGTVASIVGLASGGLSLGHLLVAKPAIDVVYGATPPLVWGVYGCMAGLATMSAAGITFILASRPRSS